jgi:hypothetical protein
MKRLVIMLAIAIVSNVWAGRVLKHQNRCPGRFKEMNVCLNYKMPDEVQNWTNKETPITIEVYTMESAYKADGNKEYVDLKGSIQPELMMAHGHDNHMTIPITLNRVGVGHYEVQGAKLAMPGMYGITLDLFVPERPLGKRAELFFYIYPDQEN